jgi:hypothetical protein
VSLKTNFDNKAPADAQQSVRRFLLNPAPASDQPAPAQARAASVAAAAIYRPEQNERKEIHPAPLQSSPAAAAPAQKSKIKKIPINPEARARGARLVRAGDAAATLSSAVC